MIEIRNIVKTYRPKKGGVVKVLDGVSLKFPEKGLVFVLGKSGSGKSTLLNVMGGLDNADSGEIIIKGKSSKDFLTGDFDSYRNTYLGFIFQEYNILEDFNVGANIALALKLEGEKATDEIAISDYAFDCFKKWGYFYVGPTGIPDESKNIEASDIKTAKDFIKKEPNVHIEGSSLRGVFKIVGVLKTGYDYSRYGILDKTVDMDDALDYYMLQNQFTSEHNGEFSGMLFGGENFIEEYL